MAEGFEGREILGFMFVEAAALATPRDEFITIIDDVLARYRASLLASHAEHHEPPPWCEKHEIPLTRVARHPWTVYLDGEIRAVAKDANDARVISGAFRGEAPPSP